MVDITQKSSTLRQAVASAILLVSDAATIDAIQQRKVPKGDVFEFSRAAGLLAIKKTSDVIPDCHPLPVEFAAISFEVKRLEIHIQVEVHTIYKTGVEVEAMHGAAITALTMYDMLKPIDKGIVISTIKLESKKGGKTDSKLASHDISAAVIVCSDSASTGVYADEAGEKIKEKLEKSGIAVLAKDVIPDDVDLIQQKAKQHARDANLLIFVGGTGVSARDNTPEAIRPLLTKEIPGIMEAARNYGQLRMPYAMLSRGVAGLMNNTLVLTVPGSTKGALETLDAIFPHILHVFKVKDGSRH